MRQQGVDKLVPSTIRQGVRRSRGSEQAEANDVALDVVAVFAIVEESDAVTGLREIRPFLCADLELSHIPARIGMVGAFKMSKLDLVCRLLRIDINGKGDLQKFLALVPIDFGGEIDAG